MNVIFHTSVAVGIAALLGNENHKIFKTSLLAFSVGIIFHGILDYIPHCYPIDSKLDVISSLIIIGLLMWKINKDNRFILFSSFIGSIFPDLIDLSTGIVNKLFSINLPVYDKIFPWHWKQYSGSIYNGDCNVSSLNHLMIIFVVALICYYKRLNLYKGISAN